MATLPSATVLVDDAAGGFAGATGYAVIMAAVGKNADCTPRVMASAKAVLDQHDYSPGADYVAQHIEGTGKAVIFIGMPAATAGAAGRFDSSGVAGSSTISLSAGTYGYLEETDGVVTVVKGGTVGTDLITFNLSLDGGRTTKLIRLGTANSYAIPYVGIVLNFGGGTLLAGDTYKFATTAPMWDSAGLTASRTALATQTKLARSWMVIGDVANSTFAGYVVTEANAYESASERFVYARAQVRDHLPLAVASKVTVRMTGAPNLTFDATAKTVVRASGSWVTDGFAVGDTVTFVGSTLANDAVKAKITTLTGTTLTASAATFTDEGPIAGYSVSGSPTLTFAASGHTITRTAGSWLDDGFAVGDSVSITGTISNNTTLPITVLTATVMTFGSGLVDESIRSDAATVVKGETLSGWVSTMDAAMHTVDGQKRIDLGAGRGRMLSPITGWEFRRPVQWAASIREYQHDVQIPCWRKSDGPLNNFDLTDGNGQVVEFDERTDGGALAARFTCARTYANGPGGAFIALSLTRATEGSLLSRTHNTAVADVACTVVQTETENAIGQVLVLKSDGTAEPASLQKIEERVNSALQNALLQDKGEGQRASKAVWSASKTDVLNTPGATLTGVLQLLLNGTLENIATRVRVQTGG